MLADYDARPCQPGAAPASWPAGSGIPRAPSSPALLMFVHPRCPCSRAGIEQLRRIRERLDQPLSVHVLLVAPPGADDAWSMTEIRSAAEAIPGIVVHTDESGTEAQRFGAMTSGHALLYDARGSLAFSGGITAARGHFGDNSAADALLVQLGNKSEGPQSMPVFGCPLVAGGPVAGRR